MNAEPGNAFGLTTLEPGDRVTMDAAGGGGYGDPFTRDPEAVRRDVESGAQLVPEGNVAHRSASSLARFASTIAKAIEASLVRAVSPLDVRTMGAAPPITAPATVAPPATVSDL